MEITIVRNNSRKGTIRVEFSGDGISTVTVAKERGSNEPAYRPATVNWSSHGAQVAGHAAAYAAVIQQAAAFAAMLDRMDAASLDALSDGYEVAEARRRGFERTAEGKFVKVGEQASE